MLTWKGRFVRASSAAYRELEHLGLRSDDILVILENGYAFPGKKRKEGIYEKCMDRGRDSIKIVVAESYDYLSHETVWVVVHAMKVRRKT